MIESDEQALELSERELRQALHILSGGSEHYEPEDWMLVATLVCEADLAICRLRERDLSIEVPLFEVAMEEFRAETDNFRKLEFLRSTRAARRRNPDLFRSH